MEWMSLVIVLEASICVTGNLSACVGRGYPRQCIQVAYWSSTGDYSTFIIQSGINMLSNKSMSGTAPRRPVKLSCLKAECQCSYGSWVSSPSGVCQFPQKIIYGIYFCFGVKSVLLETLYALQCDCKVGRVWTVVKLQTNPCSIAFAFGISVP